MQKNLVLTVALSSLLATEALANPPRRPSTPPERPAGRAIVETPETGAPTRVGPSAIEGVEGRSTARGDLTPSPSAEAVLPPIHPRSSLSRHPSLRPPRAAESTPEIPADMLAPLPSANRVAGTRVRAQQAISPRYDHLTPDTYEHLSAEQKIDILMKSIAQDPYPSYGSGKTLPTNAAGAMDMLKLFWSKFLTKVFTHESDQMIVGRQKLIHANGATAEIAFNAAQGTPYTGIFKSGAIGVARISIANPDLNHFAPGIGIKFLVDGRRSENIIAMYSLNGQGTDTNVFRNSFSNVIADPVDPGFAERQLVAAFRRSLLRLRGLFGRGDAPQSETNLPQHEVAMVESNGNVVDEAVSPYQIVLEPTAEATRAVQEWIDAHPGQDFRDSLSEAVEPGTVIYNVMARHFPGQELTQIGEIVTQSRFIASRYQDTQLNFRHGRVVSPEFADNE